MHRYLLFIGFILLSIVGFSQRVITRQEAVTLAQSNRFNTAPATLGLQQQQQLLRGARAFDNPELEYEIDPYDPTVLGVIVPLRFPTVYATRRGVQKEQIRLSELSLRLNQNEINLLVQNTYVEMQYLEARVALLNQQDSLYQSIKVAAQRNFQAGQINKLEELFATNEANNVHNELDRTLLEAQGQKAAFSYITNFSEDFSVEPLTPYPADSLLLAIGDTLPNSVQLQILQQQVSLSRQQLKQERAELLPQVNAGPLFGMANPVEEPRRLGVRIGLSVPLWFGQNRARIQAAQTGVQLAEAQRQREMRNLSREYRLTYANYLREQKSLNYYNAIALHQAAQIVETAMRLFTAGQMSYIETLRNIITAYQTRTAYLETVRNFNQAAIELKYLTGNF